MDVQCTLLRADIETARISAHLAVHHIFSPWKQVKRRRTRTRVCPICIRDPERRTSTSAREAVNLLSLAC